MKILYVTDLHGDKAKYEETLRIAQASKVDVIINGGDMLPKLGKRDIEQPCFIKEYLNDYFGRIEKLGIPYLCILANDDLLWLDSLFSATCAPYEFVFNLGENQGFALEDYYFLGLNYILDHPFGSKDRVVLEKGFTIPPQLNPYTLIPGDGSYTKIDNWEEYAHVHCDLMADKLKEFPSPPPNKKTVYVMHMPPAGLNLGQIFVPGVDIGSQDIYDFIQEKKPFLTLHGHIHESPVAKSGKWLNHIGQTTCLNPGQFEAGDLNLAYALIDTEKLTFERFVNNIQTLL